MSDGPVLENEARFTAALAAFVPGQLIDGGKYRIEGFVGAGATAAVFRAMDVVLERPVAIKVLYAGDPELLRAEAKAMARVRHDNIVQVYAFGEHAKMWFFVMELIEGSNLEEAIEHEGRIPTAAAIGILEKVAAALDAAHAQGVIHRDVKPANVLVGPRYRICVGDFGLAGIPTDDGMINGTPAYMAPELLSAEVDAAASDGRRADQYSLGITAYEMLTGRLPFGGDNLEELIRHHVADPPPAMKLDSVPSGVESAVARALAKSPSMRFASCTEFADALREGAVVSVANGPRVLVVDDDPAIRRLFSALISDAIPGARVATASDGLVALELMRASPPDLVLLDLQMPKLNGTELLHQLRGEPNIANPRVIAVSGMLGRERPTKGLHVGVVLRALGVAEQIAKPVDPQTLIDAVKRQLSG